jgi:hypothetical protein
LDAAEWATGTGASELASTQRTGKETMTLDAVFLVGSWFLILTVLVLDLIGILRRGIGFRWQAVGLLIVNTAVDISGFAHLHHWSGSQVLALRSMTSPLMLIGFATFIIGTVIQARGRRAGSDAPTN